MKVCLSKQTMENAFFAFLKEIFSLPEIVSIKVRDKTITRDNMAIASQSAFDIGYHDCYSDIDLSLKVRLPCDNSVTPAEYVKRIDRFGVHKGNALGWYVAPENMTCRIVFKNGMRYDFGFEFEYAEGVELDLGQHPDDTENTSWPDDNINRFWFVQIQALGKLYRQDHLISCHLANMNCNDTLVMQMVLRDIQHGTNHHRYGFAEELEYVKALGQCPYETENPVFNRIADQLYAAAIVYDKLAHHFDSQYQSRSECFFAIWNSYHEALKEKRSNT